MSENELSEVVLAALRAEQDRAVLLDHLLSPVPPEQVMERATELGVDLGGRRSVLIVGTVSTVVLERLRDSALLVGIRSGTIVAIIGGRVPRGAETAGLGSPGLGVTGIRASFGEAERALEVAGRLGLRGVVPFVEVLPEAVIGQDHETLRALADLTLEPLRSHRRNGPQYIETATAWFQEGLSVAATARTMGVHERTVRYRLARIAKLASLDLQHADDRFRLELALRGARLLDEASD